jgi:hypothetical protein
MLTKNMDWDDCASLFSKASGIAAITVGACAYAFNPVAESCEAKIRSAQSCTATEVVAYADQRQKKSSLPVGFMLLGIGVLVRMSRSGVPF